MANPTNINVPPAKAADPTNVAVAVHGTKFPSGVTGSDQTITLVSGPNLGAGQTSTVVAQFTAPFDMYVRKVSHSNISLTTSASFDLYNSTTSTAIFSAASLSTGAAGNVTAITAGTVSEGDVVQLRCTTAASTGALSGLSVLVLATQLNGSATNPV